MHKAFLDYSSSKLEQLCSRIETCLGALNQDQIWARGNENENAVGNLVLHLCGNVRQWIISGLGGAADVRQRDREFATEGGMAGDALNNLLQTTMSDAVAIIDGLTTEQRTRS